MYYIVPKWRKKSKIWENWQNKAKISQNEPKYAESQHFLILTVLNMQSHSVIVLKWKLDIDKYNKTSLFWKYYQEPDKNRKNEIE